VPIGEKMGEGTLPEWRLGSEGDGVAATDRTASSEILKRAEIL